MAKNKVVPAQFAAPSWQPDRSDYVILWHGCTVLEKNAIEAGGIDLSRCAVDADFGRGFYVTTLERQARQWAWERLYDWEHDHPTATGNQPVVLRFRVRRYSLTPRMSDLDDGLDKLLSLHFVRGDYDNDDYWGLVQHCRRSVPADPAAGVAEVVHDHRHPPTGWYELVSGPVSAQWAQRVAMAGSDQLSFHGDGLALLNALIARGKGLGPDGTGDPDYYQWSAMS
jgi:hypothetical protein